MNKPRIKKTLKEKVLASVAYTIRRTDKLQREYDKAGNAAKRK